MLFRYEQVRAMQCPRCELSFPSRQGTFWDQCNSLRGLHLLQEKLALPMFGCSHPEEAAEIHEDNAKIRYLLGDMRQWVASSVLRADEVKGLLTLLAAAMTRKRATLYPWADRLDDALASMLVHRLSESKRDPLPDFPATAHP